MWNDHLGKREGKEGQEPVKGGKSLPQVITCVIDCFVWLTLEKVYMVYIKRKYDISSSISEVHTNIIYI